MTTNREVFAIDPTLRSIPNDGVAKVVEPRTPAEYEVLRYELASFVCDGEYRQGMERILTTYLANLARPAQPAVWVSGFYGSGKSHFVRVLEYLWRDIAFPDGATARGLTQVPAELGDLLLELSRAGRQHGGLWSAAGTLGAGAGSVRLAMLAILFRSAQLPEQYAPARFVIWLKQNNYFAPFAQALSADGKDLIRELNSLYVSPFIARALLAADPGFATSEAEVRKLLREQFPVMPEISDDQFLQTIEDVLALQTNEAGVTPCTLFIFDELQQFIGEDAERTLHVQNIVEACSARFGSKLLFVATGQAALQATPQLSKLQGRFTVRVQLSDTDVEQVVRQVVLRKQPARVAELEGVLEGASGEISRHLGGTSIAARSSDRDVLVADYPLLPTRRRFWEAVLRAVDSAGMAGQLRTQLRIVHEATQRVAAAPLGTVVAGDFIYGQIKTNMLQSGTLSREIDVMIEELAADSAAGALGVRLCGLIFLIGKLPDSGPSATGLRATATNLADLLVEDLAGGSDDLRQRVPLLLDDLVSRGKLLQVGQEYRLQTRESAEWEHDFRHRRARIHADDSRLASDRDAELRKAFTAATRGLAFAQGASRTKRDFTLFFEGDPPPPRSDSVPVWVRSEWNTSEATVRADAQRAGTDSPIVFVLLPRRDADALKNRLANLAAAQETIQTRPAPATAGGIEARNAMSSKADTERRHFDLLIQQVIAGARVFAGGGNELSEGSLDATLRLAVEGALDRLFPDFALADHAQWGRVFERAATGSPDPLSAIGYQGEVEQHQVCRLIRSYVGVSGKRGSEVRQKFKGEGYGWPQDAIDGALLTLVGAGSVHARRNGHAVRLADLQRSQIGQTEFVSEGVPISAPQKIAVRALLATLGVPNLRPGEELTAVSRMLEQLATLADEAGGAPPLPERPATRLLTELAALSGNEQFVAVYEQRAALQALFTAWQAQREQIAARKPAWEQVQQLQQATAGLPAAEQALEQIAALKAQRGLLAEPDAVPALIATLSAALRDALNTACAQLQQVRAQELATLDAAAEWQRLAAAQRQSLIARCGLAQLSAPAVGSVAELLASAAATPPSHFEREAHAFPGRVAAAREEAARLLAPQAVTVRLVRRTLAGQHEIEQYLQELRTQLEAAAADGRSVIVL
ncbi:MAG: BREX system P-loop protein BrxC [Candidatus Viridilinea halotolerans]|uniref:BREX system P-loop protein BrxC n=1 Tax=Candidatus Viridilinea halotolerans TaxID=2491704 RepID=A0A426TXB3_9CHLR|nr:MAG: BREX system P-loop protein BrxC [Candidatus Viridilinea halotolerans]